MREEGKETTLEKLKRVQYRRALGIGDMMKLISLKTDLILPDKKNRRMMEQVNGIMRGLAGVSSLIPALSKTNDK